MPKNYTSLKGCDSIKIKTVINEFLIENNLNIEHLHLSSTLDEVARYAAKGQQKIAGSTKLAVVYNDNLEKVLNKDNTDLTLDQKLSFFQIMNTTGIELEDKITSHVRELAAYKLATYFEEKKGQQLDSKTSESMQKDVVGMLKPLGNFTKEASRIVRECASESSMKLSLKDKVLRIFDLLGDIISQKKEHEVINSYKKAAKDIAKNMHESLNRTGPKKDDPRAKTGASTREQTSWSR